MQGKRTAMSSTARSKKKKTVKTLKQRSFAKITKAGQHHVSSGLCIATSAQGKPCCEPAAEDGVPYCRKHMKSGDSSLFVAKHTLAGKILCAARDLPCGYNVPLWGKLKRKKHMTKKAMEWGFDIGRGWFIDPTPCQGSLVQFCACPGPNEVAVVTGNALHIKRGRAYGFWPFIFREKVPKMYQITMQYGEDHKGSDAFFEDMGVKRLDVGTNKYPAKKRKSALRRLGK